ncbi:hypothetical protein [Thermovenabulum sp.]|uniref:hypothetical protein n=1 Tax=Thermovenabulum sp. TaxID=3100335 RepID=UPI003C7DDC84
MIYSSIAAGEGRSLPFWCLEPDNQTEPQRPGAPQIVAPFSGSTQDRITLYGCCTSPSILKPLRSCFLWM